MVKRENLYNVKETSREVKKMIIIICFIVWLGGETDFVMFLYILFMRDCIKCFFFILLICTLKETFLTEMYWKRSLYIKWNIGIFNYSIKTFTAWFYRNKGGGGNKDRYSIKWLACMPIFSTDMSCVSN